ncbi:hypothetical protein ACF0H5_008081 [Mactra antiquata]
MMKKKKGKGKVFQADMLEEAHSTVKSLADKDTFVSKKMVSAPNVSTDVKPQRLTAPALVSTNVGTLSETSNKKAPSSASSNISSLSSIASKKGPAKSKKVEPDGQDYFSVAKAMELKSALTNEGYDELSFYGNSQITDLIFYVMMVTNKNGRFDLSSTTGIIIKCDKLTDLKLQGCYQLTDFGLVCAAKLFPNLKSIDLTGCNQITEAGLYQLLERCNKLEKVEIQGTSVTILPKKSTKVSISLTGYPVVSPPKDVLMKQGTDILKAPSYAKPSDDDVVKLCIIHGPGSTHSLIKYFKKDKDTSFDHLSTLSNFQIDNRFKVNMVECHEAICDLFITKRTVYTFAVKSGCDVKKTASWIFGLICHIINKVTYASFVIVGMKDGKGDLPLDRIVTEVSAMIKTKATSIRRSMETDLTEAHQAMTKKSAEKLFTDVKNQQSAASSVILFTSLETIKLESIELDMTKTFTGPETLKPILAGLNSICQLYPEFQDMGAPVYKFVNSGSINSMISAGIVSIESNPVDSQVMVEMMSIMGRTVSLKFLDDVNAVCLVDWLAKLISVALVPPSTSKNNGRVYNMDDDVLIWIPDDLKAALAKILDNTQASNGFVLLQKLGLSTYPSVFVPYTSLPEQPVIPLDHVFPEIPMYNKRKEEFYTVGYQALFVSPLPNSVMRQLFTYCTKMRRWTLAWRSGFVILEGIVEVLFVVKEERGDASSLCLFAHSYKKNQGEKVTKVIEEAVWNTVSQYLLALEFVLKQNKLPHTLTRIMGTEISNYTDVVTVHPFRGEEVSDGKMRTLCNHCGVTSQLNNLPWIMKNGICNRVLVDDDVVMTDNVKRIGNTISFTETGSVFFNSVTPVTLHTSYRIQILGGSANKLKIGLGHSFGKKSMRFQGRIYYDTGEQKLINDKYSSTEYKEVKSFPLQVVPEIGDEFCIVMKESDANFLLGQVMLFRNGVLLGTYDYSNHLIMPFVENYGNSSVDVVFHPFPASSLKADDTVKVGMRLEAKDRKHPSLVCVATITEIMEDGRLLIHFDGWTKTYDYVCDPTAEDIHPIGWMAANMHKYPKLTKQLQSHDGKHAEFKWEKYLKEIDALPVPYDFFTPEQLGDTTPEQYNNMLGDVTVGPSTSCYRFPNRAKVIEYQSLMKCRNSDRVFEFFTTHSKLFSLLPKDFSLTKLKHPCLADVMDFSKQNVHVLCPGSKMELLHYLDDPGVPLQNFEPFTEEQNAAFLENCVIGLLMQEDTLPTNCSKLVPGIEKLPDQSISEMWLKKLLFMYICVLYPHTRAVKTVTMTREALEVFNSCVKSEQLQDLISEGDRYIKCKGHYGSSMANSGLKEIPMDKYSTVYSFMTRLDFQNNEVATLPVNFFQSFKALEYLNLSKNGIAELPAGLGNLTDLSELDLSSNRLTKLPDEIANLSENLTILKISNNELNCIPACVFKLANLEELEAENIGEIKDFSPIRNLMKIRHLNLAYNLISKLPEELGDLHLEYLDLSGVPWIAQTTYQSYFAFMKSLNVNNVTKKIDGPEQKKMFKTADVDESSTLTPDEVYHINNDMLFPKYPRFGVGNLAFQKTHGFPPVILQLTKLKRLILRYHGFTAIPDDIKTFTNLREIDLSYNPKLTSLTAELGGLPLKQIHLKECLALNTPPKEVVARGHLAVMGYLKRLRLGAVPCRRTKLMMVGLGGAGKTSLVQSLMNQRYRAYMDHDEPITDGIDITTWEVNVKDDDGEKGGDGKLTFSVWDFAGQTVYYNTHQFFLSNRAVYLLLWNVRQGYEHAGLDFWLSSIACHAPKAPILVVGTHIDKVEKYRLPEDNLKARYPQIVAFHYVSSYTGSGVQELSKTIIENTLSQKYMGEKIPEAWLTLEKKLIAYRQEKNVDILPFKTLEGVSASCGIFDKAELVQAIQFLHDLGAVQFFDTDFLRRMIVIYPQWIVDVMACLVTVHQGVVKDGRMNLKDIDKIWNNYPKDLHPWLLRLTEEFDLTCPLPDGQVSIVPCLLPDAEPKYDWPQADPSKNIYESMTVYKFQYLPAGLFNRAQVRLHTYAQGALLWKTGSFMKKNDHIALMLQTDDQELIVRAQGFRPENFLFIVHEMIETLTAESYTGVKYDFSIPCMDCQSRHVKDPSMISHDKVMRGLELNVPFIQCEKFFHMLSIQELKDAMPSDKMSEVDSHLRNSVRELIDLTNEKTVTVFFIYSQKDVPDLANEKQLVHPGTIVEDLQARDEFKVAFTDKPETSDMEALTLAMKSNDVIIFGLSDQFAEHTENKKLLLYAKEVLQRPILLLLLGKTKDWQKGDLSLPLGDEVFVDMTKIDRYPHKIKELFEAIQKKDESKNRVKEQAPDVFLSYCWTNSHDAIAKGSREKDGALGWKGGDPREVKKFLNDKGISCWIDIERVGGVGLYTSIADGLKEAKVVLAFVSDEYVESKNCVMEFRQSLITCRIPVIVVAVGTGYKWESNEVGMMAVGHKCPKVNMQFENQSGYLQILNLIQERLSQTGSNKQTSQDLEKQRNSAFQEVLELTQRKFLRHLNNSYITNDLEPYPTLFVVDFLSDKEKADYEKARQESMAKTSRRDETEQTTADDDDTSTMETIPLMKSKYCIRLLCEHLEGCHVMPSYIKFPDLDPEEELNILHSAAPYLTRVYTIIKYSNILLECITTPEGEIFQQRMEDIGIKSGADFKEEYLTLRNLVMQQDKARTMAGLSKCHVNGKSVWLCDTHKKASRSKTEQMYEDKFEEKDTSIPIPSDEGFVAVEPDMAIESEAPKEVNKPAPKARKLFRRNISDQKPVLKRQTSQACNVM